MKSMDKSVGYFCFAWFYDLLFFIDAIRIIAICPETIQVSGFYPPNSA
jgi:hypothetical protein